MSSQGDYSQLLTQISLAFSSVGFKTQSLELLDVNYMSQDEFIQQIQSLSCEIPSLSTILKYKNLFTLFPSNQMAEMLIYYEVGDYKPVEIGVGANAKVFVHISKQNDIALKTMEKINISMLESYIQECVNQYNLIQINKDYILNFKGQVFISIANSQASLYIPLQLAEYSLYDYIQNNEITSDIYEYFFNLLIDILILLHSNNYAHRDIKPQNILFIKGEGWKLADFGESIKYEQREGLYKIQGTISFLPQEIRKQINKKKEIQQNLYKNDIYAVICSLVMIQNTKFKSKDLIDYMDTQNLDLDLQNLYSTINFENWREQLLILKGSKLKTKKVVFKPNYKLFDPQLKFNIEKCLLMCYYTKSLVSESFVTTIDTQLQSLYNNQRLDEHQKLQLYLILLCPFQIHQFNNFNQQLLNHQKIIQQKSFYLQDKTFEYIYLSTFQLEDQRVGRLLENCLMDQFVLINIIMNTINIGAIEQAKELLKILGKLMLQKNFDTDLFFTYNLFHQKLHGKSLSFNENYIEDDYLNKIEQHDRSIELSQLYIENYLIQNKFLDIDTVDMIKLFKPLFLSLHFFDDQTLNIICRHIIENLSISELSIAEEKFKLGNIIKQQLIKAGFQRYRFFIKEIVCSIVKLFIKYDLFEGLLDLLHYFQNFMKFLDRLIYHYIVSVTQNLIFRLNIPIYHIKEDLITQYVYNRSINQVEQNARYINIYLLEKLNKFYFNMIQDQQKTEQNTISLDFQILIEQLKISTAQGKQHNYFFSIILQFVEFIWYIESQKQKYLSILVISVCKYLYAEVSQSFKLNREIIKLKFDPILLQYYIYCKQYNRINNLFSQLKQKENLKPSENQLVRQLAEIFLIRQNNFNRFSHNYAFIQIEQLTRFALNQKFRQLIDFRQHLYVGSTFKSMQKRLNFRDMYLKEQYLRK